ncbi:GTP pyrophosphokinase family protein [Mucilaginibacter ximonensis]|uniref:GTP pyrophosphokinase family protein n=1 Tax=Mucilaginibacter ximonensis TaxID=538021 RepID=A0ABW5YEA4_9SPHI
MSNPKPKIEDKFNKEEAVQWYANNRGLYKKLSVKIHNIISEVIEESPIIVHAITNRTKEVESFKNKIDDPKYIDPIKQITDLSGLRIIVYVEDDLKPICEILENTFHIDASNSLDKSEELGTDKVGYRSIHYIAYIKEERLDLPEYKKFKDLKFEIQVRTILQHAWAEIEHDKNYKFNGVLPPEIKRRFKILAGSLELMDREFNSISKEIDIISQKVSLTDKKDDLKKVEINSTTLKSFLNTQLKELIKNGMVEASFNGKDAELIKELHQFGIKTLNDLQEIIPKDLKQNIAASYESRGYTLLGITRHIMIIKNADLYFTKCWNKKSWARFRYESAILLRKYIDLDRIISKYGVGIGPIAY